MRSKKERVYFGVLAEGKWRKIKREINTWILPEYKNDIERDADTRCIWSSSESSPEPTIVLWCLGIRNEGMQTRKGSNKNITIIIIMWRYQHGYIWPSLATPPYRPLLPAGFQGYVPYRHRAAECRFELVVLPLHVHVKVFTGVHHLWARPYFSGSVLHVWFV